MADDNLWETRLIRAVTDLGAGLADLVQKELRLARSEIVQKVTLGLQAGAWFAIAAALFLAAPILLLWLASPVLAWWLGRPRPVRESKLSAFDRRFHCRVQLLDRVTDPRVRAQRIYALIPFGSRIVIHY